MKTPMGLPGLSSPARLVWMRLRDRGEPVVLPDDALGEGFAEFEDRFDLVLDHPPDGDAGPVGDDGGDGARVAAREDQG
jgi:hypothetical protein